MHRISPKKHPASLERLTYDRAAQAVTYRCGSRTHSQHRIFVRMSSPVERLSSAFTGRYRIDRELGAGGMATVYLAHDEKHDRKVAIKVLKPELAAVLGAERFVQEIKTTASLSHPHILPLFDSGTADGFLFYVMPFIEGETIREKLNRETQFGVDEAVRIALEVADALHYANRHGVIHRDIKPENILLHDGRAMVMDFGIALAVSAAAGGRMTETGLSLGTPHYMSPEQATAEKEITPRSDIYSLASVLYEMLAGQPPHIGGSAQQVIMKILTEPAQPVRALRKNVPPNVEAALARALEKLPADRFESAKAFADALANATFLAGPAPDATHGATQGVRRDRRMLIGAAALAAAGLTGGWALARGNARLPSASNVSIILPDSTPLDPTYVNSEGMPTLAIAHDGSAIVFVGRKGKTTQLYVRRLSSFDIRALDGTDGAFAPFFSPNGDEVAFFAGTRLMRVSLTDGHTTQIAEGIYEPFGGTWARDGRFIISTARAFNITVLGANGDSLQAVSCERFCSMPELLPDGRHVLTSGSNGGIGVVDLQDKSVRPLRKWKGANPGDVLHGSMARYDGDGHLVWVSLGGDILAAPFDAGRVEITGPSTILAQGARVETGRGAAQFALGAYGTIVFAPGPLMSVGILVISDRTGRLDTLKAAAANYSRLELSPDGQRVLARTIAVDGLTSAVVIDVASGQVTTWVTGAERIEDLQWDVDGHRVWYRIARTALHGDPRVTTAPESLALPPRQSFLLLPDGERFLAYTGDTMFVQRLAGKAAAVSTVIRSPTSGAVTDDSRWVVQQELIGRNPGLVARALDSSARRLVISNNPDFSMAATTPGAGEIIVGVNGLSTKMSQGKIDEQSFWSIPYTPGSATPFGQPHLLFRASVSDFPGRNYGVGLKGQRLVFKQHVASQPPREIRLVQNWHAALTARGKNAAK